MKHIKRYSIILLLIVVIGACEQYTMPVIPEPVAGSADFTKMVSVGSSLTAGFMNGALYTDGQNASFMSILAKQMKTVGGGEFNQPDIGAEAGYYGKALGMPPIPDGTILGHLYLKNPAPPADPLCTTSGPGPAPIVPGDAITAYAGDKSKLNNFSAYKVSIQLSMAAALGGPPPPAPNPYYNPWFARFAATPSADGVTGSTLMSDAALALSDNGTFFVFWLGTDDVLGYALNGANFPDPTAPLTATLTFTAAYNAALDMMLTAQPTAKGILGNIPDVSSLPHFTTVGWNPVVFLSCDPVSVATVNQLNSVGVYGGFNGALDALVGLNVISQEEADKRKVVFKHGDNKVDGANGVVIVDETLTDLSSALGGISAGLAAFGQVRQTNENDLLPLSAGSVLPTGLGVSPLAGFLPDKYVLIPSEIDEIQTSISEFNDVIKAAVDAHSDRLTLFDANAILKEVASGSVEISGAGLTASIVPPAGAFSLDGVHPNARGQAYIANKFIEAINKKWASTIPSCNPNDYPPNDFPVN